MIYVIFSVYISEIRHCYYCIIILTISLISHVIEIFDLGIFRITEIIKEILFTTIPGLLVLFI